MTFLPLAKPFKLDGETWYLYNDKLRPTSTAMKSVHRSNTPEAHQQREVEIEKITQAPSTEDNPPRPGQGIQLFPRGSS